MPKVTLLCIQWFFHYSVGLTQSRAGEPAEKLSSACGPLSLSGEQEFLGKPGRDVGRENCLLVGEIRALVSWLLLCPGACALEKGKLGCGCPGLCLQTAGSAVPLLGLPLQSPGRTVRLPGPQWEPLLCNSKQDAYTELLANSIKQAAYTLFPLA